MEKQEKLEKLENAVKILKTEFVGLDSIIDEIKHLITPWYITPQVLSRPIIISLWGMTGTGKTSLVKRLLELLEIGKKVDFNCGSFAREKTTYDSGFEDTIINYVSESDEDLSQEDLTSYTKDIVFILDEFQHARTVDVHGGEIERSSLQAVWSLIDSGKLTISQDRSWLVGKIMTFLRDLEKMVKAKPEAGNFKIDDFFFTEPEEVISILDSMGSFWWNRGVPSLTLGERKSKSIHYGSRYCSSLFDESSTYRPSDTEKCDEDPIDRPLKIFPDDGFIRYFLKSFEAIGEGRAIDYMKDIKSVKEYIDILRKIVKSILTPIELDCSNSLVFIIGNLDEAFQVSGDLNPDMDADVYYELTSKITIHQLKTSLLSRFRPEQVARLGNNIIKYPVLKSEYFKKIIKNEITRLVSVFNETEGISVEVDSSIYDLIYFEGVYPAQGVRPVFTTLNSIFTPVLSKISINCKSGDKVKIEVELPEEGYKLKEKNILISGDHISEKITVKLVLGSLRIPDACKTRYIKAVHEAGHAIISAFFSGIVPSDILAVGVDSGGWCVTSDPTKSKEIDSVRTIENEVRICLGGLRAETLIYGKENVLMGSSSDLKRGWNTLAQAVYKCGYLGPSMPLVNHNYESDIPVGFYDNDHTMILINDKWKDLETEVDTALKENKGLLKQTALVLGEKGRIDKAEFIELIKKYGTTLTEERIKSEAEKESCEFYKNLLL